MSRLLEERVHAPGRRPRIRAGSATIAIAVALALVAGACARNPVTGRPEAVLTTEEGEIEQGNEAAKMVEEQVGLVDEPKLAAYVDALGQRLAAHSPRTNLTHTFHIVEMKEPNAFALPGGHVYVSRGLLALVNSEDELASVIGHEIGHVAARHSVSRQAASAPLAPVRILAGIGGAAASIVSPSIGRLVSGVGQLPGALALAAYSREQEREADRLGQQFAAQAGFDPKALSRFMETLTREEEAAGRGGGLGFLHTHPNSPDRAEAAVKHAESLTRAEVDPPPLSRRAFLEKLDGLPVGDAAAEGIFVEERFLQPDLDFGIDFPKDWETQNTRRAVAASQKDGIGRIVLEVSGEGSDPIEEALAFDKQVRLSETPTRLEIGGLPAAQAETVVGGRGDRVKLLITWIAHGDLIYRISAGASPRHFDPLRSKFVDVAASFHSLSDEERAKVHQNRLRVVAATANETLAALGERADNQWSIDETAIANALDAEAELVAGNLVKVSQAEPYTPRPREHAAR